MAVPAVIAAMGKKVAANAAKNVASNVAMKTVGPKGGGGGEGGPEDDKNTLKIVIAFILILVIIASIVVSSMARGILTMITPGTMANANLCVLFPDSTGSEPPEDLNPDADVSTGVSTGSADIDTSDMPIYVGAYYMPMTDATYTLGQKYAPDADTPQQGLEFVSLTNSPTSVIAITGGVVTDKTTALTNSGTIGNAISIVTRTSENKFVTIIYRGLLSSPKNFRGTIVTAGATLEDTGRSGTNDTQYRVFVEIHDGIVNIDADSSTSLDPEKWLSDQNAETRGTPDASEALNSGLIYGDDWLNADSTTVCRVNNGGSSTSYDYPPGGVSNGGWGGYKNGNIPQSELIAPKTAPNRLLRLDAADAWDELSAAYKEHFGSYIVVTDSYRTFDEQVAMKARRGRWAATPGQSNHGWALAVDLGGGLTSRHSKQHEWMRANAGKYGWENPRWAQPGGSKLEPWHWEYVGTG